MYKHTLENSTQALDFFQPCADWPSSRQTWFLGVIWRHSMAFHRNSVLENWWSAGPGLHRVEWAPFPWPPKRLLVSAVCTIIHGMPKQWCLLSTDQTRPFLSECGMILRLGGAEEVECNWSSGNCEWVKDTYWLHLMTIHWAPNVPLGRDSEEPCLFYLFIDFFSDWFQIITLCTYIFVTSCKWVTHTSKAFVGACSNT